MTIKTKLHNLYTFIILTFKILFVGCLIILLYIREKIRKCIHLFTHISTEHSDSNSDSETV